ncbi:SDR family oxidoreductase [Lachnoclostridium pacaense]|uniref:SDR family NAD(P)-dependent oxidoreductase n=1 Tax=Enterocloster hominis (ex Hitch et al. 2024) TaxID=1917870 RepID=UPI001D10D17F|nr:SDR family oxidoreductase [Lachnoclostridium pacaense]MCC2875457.1 SDR family oxidoreductase [Lachnoclostridium pacaense]
MGLEHKMVAVTDGRTAVGRECITMLCREKAGILIFMHGEPMDQALKEELDTCHAAYMVTDAGLSDREALKQAVREAEEALGPAYGVIYNYFTVVEGSVSNLTEEQFEKNYKENIQSAMTAAQVFGAAMDREMNGKLIFIGSIHDDKPSGAYPLFSMAMGAVKNLSREAALGLGVKNVCSVFVELGPIKEDVFAPKSSYTTLYEGYQYKIPSGTVGSASDTAQLCGFLLDSRCRYVNGTEIRMDGGLLLHYIDEKANHRGLMRG